MQSELFEWDDEKAESNLHKHGVDFEEAATVFDDLYARYETDMLHSGDETRGIVTGFSSMSRVLLVVYTERTERIRFISARKATPAERRAYESQFGS